MSTGDVRRPKVNEISTKAVAADGDKPDATGPKSSKAGASKSTSSAKSGGSAKSGASRPGGKPGGGKGTPGRASGGKGRKPVTPVKVNQGVNWGPIAMYGTAGLLALLIVGFGAFVLIREASKGTWQERAAAIPGIQNFLTSNPDWFQYGTEGNHKNGVLEYKTAPPVGGVHNPVWQNCNGDVYTSPIAKEQATHSMEHGAVWVTYRPDLPQAEIDALKSKVEGRTYTLMSPYPGLDKPISLQAWGYQLKVDNASDERIDEFISALRQNATVEENATCGNGITDATEKPLDLQPDNATG